MKDAKTAFCAGFLQYKPCNCSHSRLYDGVMTDDDAFRLSRVEAHGWNAAQRVLGGEARPPDAARIAQLNPHTSDPERARWRTGFENAMGTRKMK